MPLQVDYEMKLLSGTVSLLCSAAVLIGRLDHSGTSLSYPESRFPADLLRFPGLSLYCQCELVDDTSLSPSAVNP